MSEDTAQSSQSIPYPSKVRDLMSVGVPTCPMGTLVTDIAHQMVEKDLEVVVILDAEGDARGYVSQEELVGAFSSPDVRSLKVEDIMHEEIPQVPTEIPISAAALIMQDLGVRAVFFMHHAGGISYPAGILTYKHLLRFLAARSAEELRDLGIQAARQSPLDTFLQRREAARKKNIHE